MKNSTDTTRSEDAGQVGASLEGHDRISWRFDWLCEKWSQEAVEFCQRELERRGVDRIRDGNETLENGVVVPRFIPISQGVTSDVLREIVGEPEEAIGVEGNLLLN